MYRSKQNFFFNPYFPFIRLFVALVCSLVLMFLDAYYHSFDHIKAQIAGTITSLVSVSSWPLRALHDVSTASFFPEKRAMEAEMARLRAEVLDQALRQRDIASLRALLQLKKRNPMQLLSAEVLYAYQDPWLYAVAINQGSAEGVFAGAPVINANGVLGQVIQVSTHSARVRLSVSQDAMIPVSVLRTHQPAVVEGWGDGIHLSLHFIQSFDDIRVGDVLVTSGLDQIYPRGIPVGVVDSVIRHAGTVHVSVRPDAVLQDGPVFFVVKVAQPFVWPAPPVVAQEDVPHAAS